MSNKKNFFFLIYDYYEKKNNKLHLAEAIHPTTLIRYWILEYYTFSIGFSLTPIDTTACEHTANYVHV